MTFTSRRYRNILICAAIAASLVLLNWLFDMALRDASFLSGWLLIIGMAFLTIYNLRKKFPFLPLIPSAYWLQFHVYLGFIVIVLFLLHTSMEFPRGPFEITFWLLFFAVAGSGVIGIFITRNLPGRLQQRHGERLIFERIPVFRADLAEQVRELAMKSVTEISSSTIADYYAVRLNPYFAEPRNFSSHLFQSERPLVNLRREIRSIQRYLNKRGREILDDIEVHVIAKDNLDYPYALQLVLKGWLFVHIPLTYSLMIFALMHVVLVYAFAGRTL